MLPATAALAAGREKKDWWIEGENFKEEFFYNDFITIATLRIYVELPMCKIQVCSFAHDPCITAQLPRCGEDPSCHCSVIIVIYIYIICKDLMHTHF